MSDNFQLNCLKGRLAEHLVQDLFARNCYNVFNKSIAQRKKEIDNVDPSGRVPVFLTAERLYKVLMNAGEPLLPAKELYKQESVMIPADKNKLDRPLIALYRHPKYHNSKQGAYFNSVKSALNHF